MKNQTPYYTYALLALMLVIGAIGCGKKNHGANVELSFANNTASTLKAEMEAIGPKGMLKAIDLQSNSLLGITPSIYEMKLVVFYIVEDIDPVTWDNRGAGAKIWASKKCDEDLHLCGINPAHSGEYVVDYFDLAKGSAAVNEQFNSFKREGKSDQVGAGTYRYIRMDFTGKVYDEENDRTPNLKFGSTEAHEVRAQTYGFTIALPEPLIINEGETFEVSLGYDLENRLYESGTYANPPEEVGQQLWTCAEQAADVPCVVEPVFTPTIKKK